MSVLGYFTLKLRAQCLNFVNYKHKSDQTGSQEVQCDYCDNIIESAHGKLRY